MEDIIDASLRTAKISLVIRYGIPQWRFNEVVMAFCQQLEKNGAPVPRWQKTGELLDVPKESITYQQTASLLMTFGIRPAEQDLERRVKEVTGRRQLDSAKHIRLNLKQVIELLKELQPVNTLISREEAHGPSGFIEVDDIIEILSGWKMRPEEIKEALRGHLTADGKMDYLRFIEDIFRMELTLSSSM